MAEQLHHTTDIFDAPFQIRGRTFPVGCEEIIERELGSAQRICTIALALSALLLVLLLMAGPLLFPLLFR